MTIFLVVTTAICAFGWATNHAAAIALVKYMHDKKYTPPTEKETKTYVAYAWKELLHIK